MPEDLKQLISLSASRMSKSIGLGLDHKIRERRSMSEYGSNLASLRRVLDTVEARTKQGVAERESDWQSARHTESRCQEDLRLEKITPVRNNAKNAGGREERNA
jgi:hypothetical protein